MVQCGGVVVVVLVGVYVDEFLDYFGGGGCSDVFVGDCCDEIVVGIVEWMFGVFGIDEDGGVEYYYLWCVWRVLSFCFSFCGLGMDMLVVLSRCLFVDLW